MVPGLPGQKVNGNSTPAAGPTETMVPGFPGQKVNGNSTPAVGPIETTVPGLPGQRINCNSALAACPVETTVPRFPGQKGYGCRLYDNHGLDLESPTRSNTLNALRRLADKRPKKTIWD